MNWNCFYSFGLFFGLVNTHAFRIDLFSPNAFTRVPLVHIAERLGVETNKFLVESFEVEDSIEAVASSLFGGTDEDGGPSPNAWDGTRTSITGNAAIFEMQQPGVRVFGIGLGDNDFGGESVAINGNQSVSLKQLPNHRFTSAGKAYYVLITAEEGDPDIRKVEFRDGYTIAFDHLILGKSGGSLTAVKTTDDPRDRVATLNAIVERISSQRPRSNVQRDASVQPDKPTQPAAPPREPGYSGISLLAPEGTAFVGNQLQFFNRAEPGVLSVEKPAWLYLYWTEGRDFTLSGDVRLGGAYGDMSFAGDLPDGFALFLREWDGIHRYQLDSRRVLAKRRLLKGARIEGLQQVSEFGEPARNQWVSFQVQASQSGIQFRFGESTAVIEGPLDVDGANKIAIAPGTKLRNLRLAFGTSEESQLSAEGAAIVVSADRSPARLVQPSRGGPGNTIVNGGFDNVPDQGDETGQFGETMFSPGSELLPGWTVFDGLVGLRNDPKSPGGGRVLELGPRDTPGTVSQEIQTAPGQRYILSFYACGPRGNRQIKVRAGDLERTLECAAAFERVELPFRAASQRTEISIGGMGQSGFGPMIDDVRVETAGAE